ncbi:MAG: septum formation initiator family protein [Desulfobacterales bacterium]|nr:septum formation initiator family protein [Desulfobacterales bacterium]
MDLKNGLIFSIVIVGMIVFLFIAVFGDNGAADLSVLRQEKRLIMQKNERLDAENRNLLRQIDRLKKNDLGFIENIARRELGMVREDEVILKLPE